MTIGTLTKYKHSDIFNKQSSRKWIKWLKWVEKNITSKKPLISWIITYFYCNTAIKTRKRPYHIYVRQQYQKSHTIYCILSYHNGNVYWCIARSALYQIYITYYTVYYFRTTFFMCVMNRSNSAHQYYGCLLWWKQLINLWVLFFEWTALMLRMKAGHLVLINVGSHLLSRTSTINTVVLFESLLRFLC